MSSEEKILTIKDGKIIDAQIEDALSMLEVAPAIWGFDNDGIYMAAYNSALNLVRQDIQQHKNLKDKYAKMKIELFPGVYAGRCLAYFWLAFGCWNFFLDRRCEAWQGV